ncbi:MAG: RNA methyltransferase [Methermicoccaceae archaeon]
MMPSIRVVLVEPMGEGNIGACARLVKNFGAEKLVLVNPPPLGDEARMLAVHAQDVLDDAVVCSSLKEAIEGCSFVIGTTGVLARGEDDHYRFPMYDVHELGSLADGKSVAVVFGRESCGLTNDELVLCDVVATIPTSPAYPSLNLSHAVAIVLYELSGLECSMHDHSSVEHREGLVSHLDALLVEIDYPAHKRKKTIRMARRLLGRAHPTVREVFTLRGIIRKTMWAVRHKNA